MTDAKTGATPYMGQIMAECDCTRKACETGGVCLPTRNAELEAENARLRIIVHQHINHLTLEAMSDGPPHETVTGKMLRLHELERRLAEARAALTEGQGHE